MLWIKISIIIILLIYLFLYIIVHGSARSVDDDMQRRLDDEQARIVSELSSQRSLGLTETDLHKGESVSQAVSSTSYHKYEAHELHRENCVNESADVNNSFLYRIIKRVFDIVLSAIALVLLSPVILITIIVIKLDDQGPAFFTQNRIGKGKSVFRMYKFRSMKLNAAEIHEKMKTEYGCDDVSFKLKDDPRVTKVGVFIRKTNIDELPQLLNILKGEMSFVGPRPLPDYEFQEEQKLFLGKYDNRYKVPQGLTCIWQISNRSEPDFAQRMQMDVDYAEKCGLYMDIKLFIQTLIYFLIGKAAY